MARTRYHRPIDPASLDPVVTGGRDRLRFESFSGCCGVYARLDVTPDDLTASMMDSLVVERKVPLPAAGYAASPRCR
ncbi:MULTISPECIES: hypothetical protein [unclassified Micromonospora]|uniref:hypothetical protein n=1 Tax=unclassified Micromonospora TaxID=2617518 RepID=UPI003A83A439